MLHVEDWAEIRRLHFGEGMPIKQIARHLKISKNTVKAKLAADTPPKYERASVGSVVDEAEPKIRELLQGCPTMPATVIAERIGWTRGMTVLTARVRELRPVYLPPDPASRTAYVAGEIAQNDFWFPDIELPVGFGQTRTAKQLPVLTMVTAYSRMLFALLLPTRTAQDLYAGWWRHLSRLGAVPRVLVWDGEGAVGEYAGGRNKLTRECHEFRGQSPGRGDGRGVSIMALHDEPCPVEPGVLHLAEQAAQAIRELNHRTRHHDAFAGPAELDWLLADLTATAQRLPQLLEQLCSWLNHERDHGKLHADTHTNPADLAALANAQLTSAGRYARQLATALDIAHQHAAHLATA
jgi:transposase